MPRLPVTNVHSELVVRFTNAARSTAAQLSKLDAVHDSRPFYFLSVQEKGPRLQLQGTRSEGSKVVCMCSVSVCFSGPGTNFANPSASSIDHIVCMLKCRSNIGTKTRYTALAPVKMTTEQTQLLPSKEAPQCPCRLPGIVACLSQR